jgi:ABC-type Fe3+/spermidine/putrescine transport system ATPase subunit
VLSSAGPCLTIDHPLSALDRDVRKTTRTAGRRLSNGGVGG